MSTRPERVIEGPWPRLAKRRFVDVRGFEVACVPDQGNLPLPGDLVVFARDGHAHRYEVLHRLWRYGDGSSPPDLEVKVRRIEE